MSSVKPPAGGEIGVRYGPLVVDSVLTYGRKARLRFRCDCGNLHEAMLHLVKASHKKGTLYGCKNCQGQKKSEIGLTRFDPARYFQKRFGRLLVTGVDIDPDRRNVKSRLVCLCDCGGQVVVRPMHLTTGKATSCGCFHQERLVQVALEIHTVHANASSGELNGHTPLYRAWSKIRACCKAGKTKGIGLVNHDYDQRWDDFRVFYSDFGPIGRYQTISRADQSKPWSKENCFVNFGRRHLFEKKTIEANHE